MFVCVCMCVCVLLCVYVCVCERERETERERERVCVCACVRVCIRKGSEEEWCRISFEQLNLSQIRAISQAYLVASHASNAHEEKDAVENLCIYGYIITCTQTCVSLSLSLSLSLSIYILVNLYIP